MRVKNIQGEYAGLKTRDERKTLMLGGRSALERTKEKLDESPCKRTRARSR